MEPGSGALNAAKRALKQNRDVFIYTPDGEAVLPQPLAEMVSPIHGIDELDSVVDQLQLPENGDRQMHLL